MFKKNQFVWMKQTRLEKVKVEFGKKVKESRESQNMSQLDLAIKSGLDVRQIGRVENAEVNTSLTTIYSIAKALDVAVGDLFDF
jgi:transcriptional regulator with XRE-family HTH domain